MDKLKSIREWLAAELNDRMDEMNLRPHHLMSLCQMSENETHCCLKGTAFPGLFSLVLMADHLECTVNDLLGYEEVEEIEVYERYTASSMYFAECQYAVCLADRMRRYLDSQRMSFPDLAAKTDIKTPTLRRWFAKTHPQLPSTAKFITICEVLECTPTELLGY